MKKIKAFIIHLLGGVTREENTADVVNSAGVTRWSTLHNLRTYMELANGCSADEWCDIMYRHVLRLEEECKENCRNDE